MKTTTLTKQEFIQRSMAGEKFEYKECIYFYDGDKDSPFRFNDNRLGGCWDNINGKTVFNIIEPEPIVERRWQWRIDHEGITCESNYMSDEYAKKEKKVEKGWYKVEDCFIDVEVK